MQTNIRGIGSEKFRVAIDATGCRIQSIEAVTDFLIGLVTTIKVKLRSMTVLEIENLEPGHSPGILASALYLESSMTLHVSPEREEVSLDIFLYRETDISLIVNALEFFYRPKHVTVDIKRNFSTNLPQEDNIPREE